MKLIRIIKADLEGLATAAEIVARGGVICYPTDTVYGLGCDPLNVPAVQKTMKAKGDRTKPMPILVRSLEDAGKLAQVYERAKRLADRFWPGPLTIILQAREILPRILVPDGTIGLRSPKHPICLNLLELCSGMLVGTSANLTDRPPATSAKEALDELGDQVEVILDGGRSPLASASTVVDLTQGKLVVLREGPIGKEELLRCLRSHVER